MEYLACGRPVIVNWEAFGDKFSNNKTRIGIQIDLNNLEEAADSIIKLLENEDLRISMGKRARQFIEKNYSWEITAKQILEECIKLTQ